MVLATLGDTRVVSALAAAINRELPMMTKRHSFRYFCTDCDADTGKVIRPNAEGLPRIWLDMGNSGERRSQERIWPTSLVLLGDRGRLPRRVSFGHH